MQAEEPVEGCVAYTEPTPYNKVKGMEGDPPWPICSPVYRGLDYVINGGNLDQSVAGYSRPDCNCSSSSLTG